MKHLITSLKDYPVRVVTSEGQADGYSNWKRV